MGLQISRGLHSEVPEEDAVAAATVDGVAASPGCSRGLSWRRRAEYAAPCHRVCIPRARASPTTSYAGAPGHSLESTTLPHRPARLFFSGWGAGSPAGTA